MARLPGERLTLTKLRLAALVAASQRYDDDVTPLKLDRRTSVRQGTVNSTTAGELTGMGLCRFSTEGRYLLITPAGQEAVRLS